MLSQRPTDLFCNIVGTACKYALRRISYVYDATHVETEDSSLPPIEKPFISEENIVSWLQKVSPAFPVDPSKVTVLHEPQEFYNTLLELSRKAESQISLASLYLGTGTLEQELVNALEENLSRDGSQVKLRVLLDFNRGSRGPCSSRDILQPLVSRHPDKCEVALYHTPALREPLRSLLPNRYNELVGLQHMKVYAFDDHLLISGANLSRDYFTQRQDRYALLRGCGAVAAWAHSLVRTVAGFSFRLQPGPGSQESLPPLWPPQLHPFARDADPAAFAREARRRVTEVAFGGDGDWDAGGAEKGGGGGREGHGEASKASTTWVFPLLQMAQLGLLHDSLVTAQLLAAAPPRAALHLATGYFNLTPEYAHCLLHRCQAHCHLLAAHPTANGFLGARGPAGAIPMAYATLASYFAARLSAESGPHRSLALSEYAREGWTFHAKGLWLALPGKEDVSLTLVGSPNFGGRSVRRDLELQLAIVTADPKLQRDLTAERDRLFALGSPPPVCPSPERPTPPLWVRALLRFATDYF